MLKVGLTGGIGAGKSTVATILAEFGAFVVDADRLAHEVVAPGSDGLAKVIRHFGRGILTEEGSLDRKALAQRVFGDDVARAQLEAIIHPLVRERANELVQRQSEDTIVVEDIPLLVETRSAPHFHLVIDVEAPHVLRLQRLAERGMAAEDAQRRINAQASDRQRREACDVVIENSGDVDHLRAELRRLWTERIEPASENLRLRRAATRPEKLQLVEPDPEWAHRFERIAARLRYAMGPNALRIDHTGSTAIWGLKAKDVIDVQVTVLRLSVVDSLESQLNGAGFFGRTMFDEPKPEFPEQSQWEKRLYGSIDPGNITHIHMRQVGTPGQRYALMFRDWLRDDIESRNAYAEIKERAAANNESTTEYVGAKEPWFGQFGWPGAHEWAAKTGWRPPLC
ncbi:dephospho-CoA kinase [Natronoglycomyces albus]|uniref:Dephospho-CoA kinase n=1 Tax=Natronoglycomyces albus TaxID=2811108 RepID=A0A895XNR8_9ACTN|nr:dephospho-CoA kinase [Natronoglycomyces albus]QSB03940.1 dephospho-CoA kinase [Natronoglycomyces albus]